MKLCSRCKKEGDFCIERKAKDGLQSQCKRCKSELIGLYLKLHPEKRFRYENGKRRPNSKITNLKSYYKNRISMNISRRIRQSLDGSYKSNTWEAIVGYTLDELKKHLQSKFQEGMTWSNYGMWHIDHIRPISSFNIVSDTDETFKQCWALNNLQPLWRQDNLKKGNQYALSLTA